MYEIYLSARDSSHVTLFVGILKHMGLKPLRKNLSGTFGGKVRAIFGLGTFASRKRDIFRPRHSASVPACSRLQERSIQLCCSLQLVCWCLRATPWADDHDGEFLLRTPIHNMHDYTADLIQSCVHLRSSRHTLAMYLMYWSADQSPPATVFWLNHMNTMIGCPAILTCRSSSTLSLMTFATGRSLLRSTS